jgi:hypothetical protein
VLAVTCDEHDRSEVVRETDRSRLTNPLARASDNCDGFRDYTPPVLGSAGEELTDLPGDLLSASFEREVPVF